MFPVIQNTCACDLSDVPTGVQAILGLSGTRSACDAVTHPKKRPTATGRAHRGSDPDLRVPAIW